MKKQKNNLRNLAGGIALIASSVITSSCEGSYCIAGTEFLPEGLANRFIQCYERESRSHKRINDFGGDGVVDLYVLSNPKKGVGYINSETKEGQRQLTNPPNLDEIIEVNSTQMSELIKNSCRCE